MRTWSWALGLAAGLAVGGAAHAQSMGFGTNNSSAVNRFSGANRTGSIGPTTYVGSPFRLGNLFPSLNLFSNRNQVGRSYYPDPNSPEYLKMFGFKKLY